MRVPLTRPWLGEPEEEAVLEVLRSGMLVQGSGVARFEALVAEASDRQHGVALTSGTSALELALRALDVGPGDEVLIPALTWPSPAHAAHIVGASVTLVDVDPDEWNTTPEAFAAARSERTKAVIAIDQFGNPCRGPALRAALPDVAIIEDSACSLGSTFSDGSPCGSLGAISCMSFHPRKILTTGEGGMCLTDDEGLAAKLRVLRNHGQSGPGVFEAPGGNHRLTEMAGVIGVAQMARLEAVVESRRRLGARIREALADLLQFQSTPAGAQTNYQTLGVLLPAGTSAERRDATVARLQEAGVGAGRLTYDLGQIPTAAGPSPAPTPRAADIAARGFAMPLFPQMQDDEVAFVIERTRAVLGNA